MPEFTSVRDYQTLLINGQTSCVEAVSFYLNRIKSNANLNAFLELYEDEALQRASYLDSKRKSGVQTGKMHGVVVGLKDVICYKNHTVSAGSRILENFRSVYSATVIENLLAEDAIIIGRQNCDEFAMGSSTENSAYGPVLNAADNSKVPGGSSGGSAVAVQAGLCMISLGSDTGGSVRQPADFCGVVGLKPSYGRVSRYGLIAYASSFDQIGIFAKTVADAALTLEVISGKDDYDSTALEEVFEYRKEHENKIYNVGYFPSTFNHPSLDGEIAAKQKDFLEQLPGKNINVKPIDFDLLDYIAPAYYILTTSEASSNLSRYDGIKYGASIPAKDITEQISLTRSKYFGKEVKRRILLGTFVLSEGYYDDYVSQAQKVRTILLNKIKEVFCDVDAILMPVSPTTAFSIGQKNNDPVEMFLADIYTVFANLTGIPGIAIPLFTHSNGMPFGVQLMSSHANELTLLSLSEKIAGLSKTLQ